MIRPHHLGESSTFVGQTCALCKQEFVAADAIVICPEDGSRHHVHCWEANNNHCTAYGCTVSYTHLDVYKRQIWLSRRWRRVTPSPAPIRGCAS